MVGRGLHQPADILSLLVLLLFLWAGAEAELRRVGGDAAAGAEVLAGHIRNSSSTQSAPCSLEFKPKKGRAARPTNEFCSALSKHRYHNAHCDTLPLVEPSLGCGVVELGDPASWQPTELRTITLWGDSLMDEVAVAFRCMLSRAVLPEQVVKEEITELHPGGTAAAGRRVLMGKKKKKQKDDCSRCQNPIEWNSGIATDQPCHRHDCVRFGNIRLCYVRVRNHAFTHAGMACQFLHSSPSDVFVFNVGLWHNSGKEAIVATSAWSRFVKAAWEGGMKERGMPHIVWMETPPQHFNTKGGLYQFKGNGGSCLQSVRNAKVLRSEEFRNKNAEGSVQQVADHTGVPLHMFSTWELLVHHPELHVQYDTDGNGRRKLDCSHWCQYDGNALGALSHMLLSDIRSLFWGRSNSTLSQQQIHPPENQTQPVQPPSWIRRVLARPRNLLFGTPVEN